MKITCYKTVISTTAVDVEVDDDFNPTDDNDIQQISHQANLARHLHGVKVINNEESNWYVKHDEDEIPQSINPHTM